MVFTLETIFKSLFFAGLVGCIFLFIKNIAIVSKIELQTVVPGERLSYRALIAFKGTIKSTSLFFKRLQIKTIGKTRIILLKLENWLSKKFPASRRPKQ